MAALWLLVVLLDVRFGGGGRVRGRPNELLPVGGILPQVVPDSGQRSPGRISYSRDSLGREGSDRLQMILQMVTGVQPLAGHARPRRRYRLRWMKSYRRQPLSSGVVIPRQPSCVRRLCRPFRSSFPAELTYRPLLSARDNIFAFTVFRTGGRRVRTPGATPSVARYLAPAAAIFRATVRRNSAGSNTSAAPRIPAPTVRSPPAPPLPTSARSRRLRRQLRHRHRRRHPPRSAARSPTSVPGSRPRSLPRTARARSRRAPRAPNPKRPLKRRFRSRFWLRREPLVRQSGRDEPVYRKHAYVLSQPAPADHVQGLEPRIPVEVARLDHSRCRLPGRQRSVSTVDRQVIPCRPVKRRDGLFMRAVVDADR